MFLTGNATEDTPDSEGHDMPDSSGIPLAEPQNQSWQVLHELPDAVFFLDVDSDQILDVNEAARRLTGFRSEQLAGHHISRVLSSKSARTWESLLASLRGKSTTHSQEGLELLRRDGRKCSVNVSAGRMDDQSAPRNVLLIRDVTTRQLIREELRRTRDLIEETHRHSKTGSFSFDIRKKVFQFSATLLELFRVTNPKGLQPDDLIQRLHEDDQAEARQRFHELVTDGWAYSSQFRVPLPDGSFRILSWASRLQQVDRSGQPRRVIGVVQDVTGFEESTPAERYQRLFHESPTALCELDWSLVRERIDELQSAGVEDLRKWYEDHPDELPRLARRVRIVDANEAMLQMYGAESLPDFSGQLSTVFRDDSLPAFLEQVLTYADGGTQFECETVNYRLNGERIHVGVSVNVAPGFEETLGRLYSSIADMTRRKQAELLRDGQRRILELFARGADTATVLKEVVVEVERQSPGLHCALFTTDLLSGALSTAVRGSVAEELTILIDSMTAEELFAPGAFDDSMQFDLRLETPENASGSFPPFAPEAVRRAADACGYPITAVGQINDTNGRLLGALAAFRTQPGEFTGNERDAINSFRRIASLVLVRQQDQKSLDLRKSELNSIFQIYPDALLRVAADGSILERYGGEPMLELLGPDGFLEHRRVWNLVPEKIGESFRDAMNKAGESGEMQSVDFSLNSDIGPRNLEARFLPLPEAGDQIAVLRDVTRLKQTERALKFANEQFQYLFDMSPDAIFVESLDGVVLNANVAACELHQMSREDLIGSNVSDLVPNEDRERTISRMLRISSGEITEFESRSQRVDGTVIPVSIGVSPIQLDGDKALLLHVRDITERQAEEARQREHEQQLAHVARLTMMGQLVAGIAHEIRQPLWSISTFADVCLESLKNVESRKRPKKLQQFLEKLVAESKRVTAITTRMFSFARKGVPERTVVSLEQIIQDAVAITRTRAATGKVETVCKTGRSLPEINCDRVLIEQTIVNLLNNAYAALAEKTKRGTRKVWIAAARDGKEKVRVTVEDNGPGLPDEIEPEQLFEGFFTTTGTGMGIGLALCRSFVEDHGGEITAERRSRGGMVFRFTLRVDGGEDQNAE